MTTLKNSKDIARFAFAIGQDNSYGLELYRRYRRDPDSVPLDWRLWFEDLDGPSKSSPPAGAAELTASLIAAYRQDGHMAADLDPLGLAVRTMPQRLENMSARARSTDGPATWSLGNTVAQGDLSSLQARLEQVYTGPAALEAQQVDDETARSWLEIRFEQAMLTPATAQELARAYRSIGLADTFERFAKLKFSTKKRFGSEGAEGALVILQEILRQAAVAGIGDVIMGGMHRGRLATLATVLKKNAATLLAEIKGRDLTEGGPDFTGDVPYHLGHVTETQIEGHPIRLTIAPHPSHLMVVAAVTTGLVRGRLQDDVTSPLCLLMHTDAALSGQGLSAELAQLSKLEGYRVGGTIHLVVNNQIGFTTLPSEGRSARYCTDVAKMVGAPVLHVNGDDPAALLAVAQVAFDWRKMFGTDIYIDLVCYRRNGHNELDEPRFTNPEKWTHIDAATPLRDGARARLDAADSRLAQEIDRELASYWQQMATAFETIDSFQPNDMIRLQSQFSALERPAAADLLRTVETGVDLDILRQLAVQVTEFGPLIEPHPKVRQFYEARRYSVEADTGLNFATAEALAFASLLAEGHSVRLSGQDSVRGTFTQRHLRVTDLSEMDSIVPLSAAARDGAHFTAINSPLSEYAVLGFEYGHSLADPSTLTLWEAQFGDFVNGAQVIVDQYITSAEAKWDLLSGLVLLLPHGLEGQGPDHSSCRLERILQACANGNIIVANPTTPANYFHMLRRQICAGWRKPLFVASPKSLLRAKAAQSPLSDFGAGTCVSTTLYDGPQTPETIVMSSGKIVHELATVRDEMNLSDRVGILRIEQLYPLDLPAIRALTDAYSDAKIVWCQEEPKNQGAYYFVRNILFDADMSLLNKITYVGRPELPVAAGGSIDRHNGEQRALILQALGILSDG